MLRNNRGFFLLELLLSLSALLLLSLFLIPLFMDVRDQLRQIEIENSLRKFMYEELQAKVMDGRTFNNYTAIENGIEYQISWRDSTGTGQMEVCVKVEENSILHEMQRCAVLE
jgi:competence protein ComGE